MSGGSTIIKEPGSEDLFGVVFRPAKPVLDAVIETLEPLRWLDQRRRSHRPLFEPERASELIDIIPSGNRLAKAGALFLEAEEISAPEGWLHVALGVMLQAEDVTKAIDGDAYRGSVADGAYRDPEVWGQYRAGFSSAVIVRAIRQARLQGALPLPGSFLNLCVKHRKWFKARHIDVGILMDLRYAAEDALEEEIGRPALLGYDDDEVPFS